MIYVLYTPLYAFGRSLGASQLLCTFGGSFGEAMAYECSGKTIASKCFCMCDGDFVDCCCPDLDKCRKCKENCVSPSKRKRLRLDRSNGKESCSTADKENDIRFQFLTAEEMNTIW